MLTARSIGYELPDRRWLFSGESLTLEAGETVSIEGPSGVGKSTLLAVLGGLLQPSCGAVEIEPRDEGVAPVAWVLQTLNALGSRTVLANAGLLARLDGLDPAQIESRALALLRQLSIDHLAEAKARRLSGGELQRLTVVNALCSWRPIVLADEPTNQLDAKNARTVMSTIAETAERESRAVVIVTHDHDALPSSVRRLRLGECGLRAV